MTKKLEKKKVWNGGTVEEYVVHCRTQRVAASAIGVTEGTLNRWLHDHLKPTGLTLKEFKRMRITGVHKVGDL